MNNRNVIYMAAKAKKPNRWSGKTRNWKPIDSVKGFKFLKELPEMMKNDVNKRYEVTKVGLAM
ncbi:MAG: hypothetical protein IPK04_15845 [Bdellovibrionales bacterium]|nr:hypothetical protein [Bdellovibrionales bacterium]